MYYNLQLNICSTVRLVLQIYYVCQCVDIFQLLL